MCFFCGVTMGSSIKMGNWFIIHAIVSGACAILSIILLYSYFNRVVFTKYLLYFYIVLLILLFGGSALCEIIMLNIKFYPFVMKCSLYGFCIAVPIKELHVLNNKFKRLNNKD